MGLLRKSTDELIGLANKCFIARGNYINIVHQGEIQCVAAYLSMNAELLVLDERTTRYLKCRM